MQTVQCGRGTRFLGLILVTQLLMVSAAVAEPRAKPGSWEMTLTMQGMATTPSPKTVRYCINKDSFALDKSRQEKDCNFSWSTDGDDVRSEMQCASGAWGKTRMTYKWDRMQGEQQIRMPGNSHVMKILLQGRWLHAECEQASQ